MGDSDDEYDRRRRDKFRKERSDYQERRDERGRRDDGWMDGRRESWTRERNRRDYREYDVRRRDRYTPPRHDLSPPMKRMRGRTDWDERNYSSYDTPTYSSGGMIASHQGWGPPHDIAGSMHGQHNFSGHGRQRDQDMGPTQPPMMTFKQFLASQDDTISDEEAVKKYNEYKQDFRRQQLNDFFITHKEEEWFKSKYHPEECGKKQAEQMLGLKRRLEVFLEFHEKNSLDAVTCDADKADDIVKLLDSVVIKLEGGTDNDLKILDQMIDDIEKGEKQEMQISDKKPDQAKKKDKPERLKDPLKAEKKRKRNKEFNFDEGEETGSESESEPEALTPVPDETLPPGTDEKSVDQNHKSESNKTTESNNKEMKDDEGSLNENDDKAVVSEEATENSENKKNLANSMENEDSTGGALLPRPLHKTCSIFLRNLAPTITKQEVEAMCKRYPGFLRVAIADPQPERRFFRRGWVTFERGVNIKEICWNLNNIRLRDCELGAIVNRDLTRRIRSVNGITSHKQVVRADIKLAAKIIQNLDSRHDLWIDELEAKDSAALNFGLISKNPLLKNITDYLIEEASAEEEELLGTSGQDEKTKENEGVETTVERDETLIKVVDRLLLYLRIVHSVDYYNHSDYPNEDEMPNRCGIMHARGPPPTSKVTHEEGINEYITMFEQKIQGFLLPMTKLAEGEALKLGKKDPDAEVEKFIQANTQELAKDKWLCPLSGKKFKGPEFVRKHIFNKHGEKIEEVKKEVEYFNNYLLDPKRPQLPEHPGNKVQSGGAQSGGTRGDNFGPQQSTGYAPQQYGYSGYGQATRGHMGPSGYQGGMADAGMYSHNYGGRGNFGEPYRSSGYYSQKRGRSQDSRDVVGYHDLDAPDDMDLF